MINLESEDKKSNSIINTHVVSLAKQISSDSQEKRSGVIINVGDDLRNANLSKLR